MGRILLQTGEYTTTPYSFDNLGIRVYSIEELCYVLRENAFLLDREILDKRLIKWIGEVLRLPELAGMLAPLLHNKTSVGAFVRVILSYVGLYDEDEVGRIEELFFQGMGLNAYEKLKTRIDYMVESRKYTPAIIEYDALLARLPENETVLRARILHNKGTALCGLFLFEEAAVHFEQAYELDGDEETFIAYLAAKRLAMKEGDYIAFAAGLTDRYDDTLELERRMETLQAEWEQSEEKQFLNRRSLLKDEGDVAYYEETDRKVQDLKNRYRENVNG
ncbi:MAG: hypothetical protein J1E83_00100 [Lachnospiraceae bacterium]|nr:hypothetical protein [Lachnospiraceae bacterium]